MGDRGAWKQKHHAYYNGECSVTFMADFHWRFFIYWYVFIQYRIYEVKFDKFFAKNENYNRVIFKKTKSKQFSPVYYRPYFQWNWMIILVGIFNIWPKIIIQLIKNTIVYPPFWIIFWPHNSPLWCKNIKILEGYIRVFFIKKCSKSQ